MPTRIIMAEGVLQPNERVYQTHLGKFIKTRNKDCGVVDGFKMLCFSACEVDEDGVLIAALVDDLAPEIHDNDGEIVVVDDNLHADCIPDRRVSVQMSAIAARSAVMIIEAETAPTTFVVNDKTKNIRDGNVWLNPDEEAQIYFLEKWRVLGNYGADNTARVKLQIDATKEIGHLRAAFDAENHLAAASADWEI